MWYVVMHWVAYVNQLDIHSMAHALTDALGRLHPDRKSDCVESGPAELKASVYGPLEF